MLQNDRGLVVGYVRVSTERQATEGQSIETQEDRIRAYARANGLTVDRIYKDNGASGKDVNRPSLARLLDDLEQIGVVIVYKFDRISRSVVDLYSLLERFQTAGVAFKSVSEGVGHGFGHWPLHGERTGKPGADGAGANRRTHQRHSGAQEREGRTLRAHSVRLSHGRRRQA